MRLPFFIRFSQKKTGTGFLQCPLFVTIVATQSPSTAFAMMLRWTSFEPA